MRKKPPRRGSLSDYLAEVLKNAVYEKGEQLDVIVAEAPDLPGCLTQGATFEEARENLVDAIGVWLMSGLRSGEDPPLVNGCHLAITKAPRDGKGVGRRLTYVCHPTPDPFTLT